MADDADDDAEDGGYDVTDIARTLPDASRLEFEPPPKTMPTPPIEVAWLTKIIGPELMLRMVECWGGTLIYIPHEPTRASPLARVIGLNAAQRLGRERGGDSFVLPLLRWWRVRVENARGLSDRDIARKLVMTEAHVSKMLRAATPGGKRKKG